MAVSPCFFEVSCLPVAFGARGNSTPYGMTPFRLTERRGEGHTEKLKRAGGRGGKAGAERIEDCRGGHDARRSGHENRRSADQD